MNSIEHPQDSRLICPTVRFEFSKRDSCKKTHDGHYLIIDNSDDFSYVKGDNSSHSQHHIYPLFWCNNKESEDDFWCGACDCKSIGTTYYFCNECKVAYHKECVESPPLIKSPYHPKHNLQLILFDQFVHLDGNDRDISRKMWKHCCYCGSSLRYLFYHCSLCSFSIDLVCARKPSFLNYKKRHEHTLTLFPRKTNLICDVCGLPDDNKSLIYVCLQCDFVVHKSCIYLPFVIRISRHEHRISFTYSSPSGKLSCGVCRQNVDENCGKYSCVKDCTYVVHSKCATQIYYVWDGKELEDVPEEVYEHLKSFEVIGDGVIQHFSHPHHHMRFENWTDMPYDEKIRCEACVLPFYDGDVYKCMDSKCGFVLHEACANLPRTKQHMAYSYPLTLQRSDTVNYFCCHLCRRFSCGFKYASREFYGDMGVDVRCGAISEPFDHPCHMHPLFLTTGISNYKTCSMCGRVEFRPLNCLKCAFVSCFGCATLPYRARYEHDEHFLTLSSKENASLIWCEVCEKSIKSPEWLYTCHECGVALHIDCLRGLNGRYMKPAQNSMLRYGKIDIVPNYGLSRPICHRCGKHCQDKIRFETRDGRVFCKYTELTSEDYS